MRKLLSLLYFGGLTILFSNLYVSCSRKSQEIVHLNFLDNLDTTYNIMDTSHKRPKSDMAAYFIINQDNLKCIDYNGIERFIQTDTFVQNQIKKDYARLSLLFYLSSKNTDLLIEKRSSKFLSFANDDIVIEYLWSDGKPHDTLYYENGEIKGAEKIKLK